MQAISTRLISELTQEALFAQILDAAMELMTSDAASVQMLAPDGESLALIGWRNFHPDSAAFWQWVSADAANTCGVALRDNVRVLVTDIEACTFIAGTKDLEAYRRSGIRAVQSTPLRSRAGRPLGMISTHWYAPHMPIEDDFRFFDVLARQAADIIERTRAEEALRESEERFRRDLTGQPLDAVLGNGWTDGMHPEDIVSCLASYASAFDRRKQVQLDFRLRRRDGEYRWIVSTGAPRYHGDGSFAGYIGSAMDVTERRLAAEALATINQRLVDAQEEERRRIARELHDDIVQRLAVLTMSLDALARRSAAAAPESQQKIAKARDEAIDLIQDVQALSHRLHPSRLEPSA